MEKRFVLAVAVCLSLFFSGCVTEERLSAAQVRDRSAAAMKAVETAAFNMSMDMKVDQMVIRLNGLGKMDIKNRKMFVLTSASMLGIDMELEQYAVGNMTYTKLPVFGWVKNQTGDGMWGKQNYAKASGDMMSGGVSLAEDEAVDGVDCYVLKSGGDVQKMMGLIASSAGSASQLSAEDLAAVKRAEVWEWVAKEDYLVKRMRVHIQSEREGSVSDMNMTITFSDYNKPVDIALPAEAEDALDLNALAGLIQSGSMVE